MLPKITKGRFWLTGTSSRPKFQAQYSHFPSLFVKQRFDLCALSNSMISSIVDNPGYSHITQKILLLLSHDEQLKCRFVGKSWKKFIDKPRFWIKKLEQKGQTKDLHDEWIDLVRRIEQDSEIKKKSESDSEMEKDVTTCLKAWHKDIHNWKEESIAGMMPIHIASRCGNNKVFRFIAAYIENPNPAKCDG